MGMLTAHWAVEAWGLTVPQSPRASAVPTVSLTGALQPSLPSAAFRPGAPPGHLYTRTRFLMARCYRWPSDAWPHQTQCSGEQHKLHTLLRDRFRLL